MAQQPAFTLFGAEQFHGIQIYDVIQDKEFNYWFATNEGIYYYDFITFHKVECSKAKSNSVFHFEIAQDGVIYCHNLNNQVFKIEDKRCSLFYELKEDEGGSDLQLIVAPDGNVLVGAKKIIVLNPKGAIVTAMTVFESYLSPPSVFEDEVHFYWNNRILKYKNGDFAKSPLKKDENLMIHSLRFFSMNNKNYAFETNSKSIFEYNPKLLKIENEKKMEGKLKNSIIIRIYETSSGIWLAGMLPGTQFLTNIGQPNATISSLYNDFFISNIFEDKEGNLLLSTFDQGILLVPNQKIKTLTIQTKEDPTAAICSNTQNGLLLGTSKGNLVAYSSGKLDTLSDSGIRPIEHIKESVDGKLIVYDDGAIRLMNLRNKLTTVLFTASLKDAVFTSTSSLFIGTNIGVFHVELKENSLFELNAIRGIQHRVYCMDYHPLHKKLYVATSDGLFVYSANGKVKELFYNQASIYPNDVYYHKNKIYLLTKGDGILVVENDKVMRQILPKVNGELKALKKVLIFNNSFYATSSNGFYQFDMNGKWMKSIHTLIGVSTKRVTDFTFHKNQLWISNSDGVQQIDIHYFKSTKQKPVLKLNEIKIDNQLYLPQHENKFTSNTQKVQFTFSTSTLKNREIITYHYRLLGSENKWNTVDFKTNQLNYNALAYGNYTFQLKAECQGVFSETIAFNFTILPPFYKRWWFVLISLMSFIFVVFLIYRRQLRIQKFKSNQLNELNNSKLTAIQSQMNPHFIFNSLNSIQDLILKGDVEHSYSYITTFSNLVRRTLSYSEKDFIEFDQEIKLLEIYLSLEKLRFKKDFNYTIQTNEISDVMLPPLLIQPFIENSLVHGLLHREGQKELTISFHLDEVLVCVIEDNGIGREKSKEIKLRQRADHESFSSKAIEKRFEILSKVFKGDFGYVYEDLMENGEVRGTKVTLRIPIKYNF